jgi:hypothetical protein
MRASRANRKDTRDQGSGVRDQFHFPWVGGTDGGEKAVQTDRQREPDPGLLCYTSVVINLGCAGSGQVVFCRSLPAFSHHILHAAAIAAGIKRGMLRVFCRGKGF